MCVEVLKEAKTLPDEVKEIISDHMHVIFESRN
jgi:hypothetical protein